MKEQFDQNISQKANQHLNENIQRAIQYLVTSNINRNRLLNGLRIVLTLYYKHHHVQVTAWDHNSEKLIKSDSASRNYDLESHCNGSFLQEM